MESLPYVLDLPRDSAGASPSQNPHLQNFCRDYDSTRGGNHNNFRGGEDEGLGLFVDAHHVIHDELRQFLCELSQVGFARRFVFFLLCENV